MMKAVSFTPRTTSATILHDVPKPTYDDNDGTTTMVTIKVKYSALDTALDPVINQTMEGSFVHAKVQTDDDQLLFCAWHYSGEIVEISSNQTDDQKDDKNEQDNNNLKVGDMVYGHLPYASDTTQGSLSEFIVVPLMSCAKVPANVPLDVAAAASTEWLTALQGLKDYGKLQVLKTSGSDNEQPEQPSVLINGAAGGVGTAAVLLAKRLMGAKVTAICSTKDVSFVKDTLGADVVIDRSTMIPTGQNIFTTPNLLDPQQQQFDVIFDTPSVLPVGQALDYIKPGGNYVLTSPHVGIWWGYIKSFFVKKGVQMFIVESKCEDLQLVSSCLESIDDLQVLRDLMIDSTYLVKDIEAAAQYNRDKSRKKKRGRVVVQVDGGWE